MFWELFIVVLHFCSDLPICLYGRPTSTSIQHDYHVLIAQTTLSLGLYATDIFKHGLQNGSPFQNHDDFSPDLNSTGKEDYPSYIYTYLYSSVTQCLVSPLRYKHWNDPKFSMYQNWKEDNNPLTCDTT